MKTIIYWLLSAGIVLPSSVSFAESTDAGLVIQEALSKKLYEHKTWLKLLHFDPLKKTGSKTSEVRSEAFFLSERGRRDPQAELVATLVALFKQPVGSIDKHAQCAFRGRYVWLKQVLKMDLRSIRCPEYQDWSKAADIDSLSLIYATGYLGNPASYYGHTLIKINTKNISDLEDSSINFGANVPDGEGMLPYILKGLLGGYDSSFTSSQYFYHSHNYAEVELRDLWEYRLDLTQYEIDLLLGHMWELLGKKYTYYFLNKNCSHRMAEVFSVLDGVDVVPNSILWSMPQSFLQKLSDVERDGRKLVKEVIYHPSRQASLYKRYRLLNSVEKRAVASLIKSPRYVDGETVLGQFDLASKLRVLDTLLDFYQFKRDAEKLEKNQYNEKYRQVLKARYLLPPGATKNDFSAFGQPHKSRKPSYLNLSYVDSSPNGEGLTLKVRPAYYDNLDGGYGHVEGAALSMGEFTISVFGETVKLRELNIVNVESINTKATGLPGDKGRYWRLRIGGERESLSRNAKFVPSVNIAAGHGSNFRLKNSYFAGYVGVGVGESTRERDALFAEAGLFAVTQLSDRFRASARYAWSEQLIDSDSIDREVSSVALRYRLGRNTDLRVSYHRNIAEEVSLSFGLYW